MDDQAVTMDDVEKKMDELIECLKQIKEFLEELQARPANPQAPYPALPPAPMGCICPPGAICGNPMCPRRGGLPIYPTTAAW